MKIFELDESLDEMAASIGGIEYERSVVDVLKRVIPKIKKGDVRFIDVSCGTAGFCRYGIDLELDVAGNDFNIELKQNTKAQMGGTSVRYDPQSDRAEIVNTESIAEEFKPFFVSAVKSKKENVTKFIDFIKQQEPLELHSKIPYRFPLSSITKEAWNAAVSQGYLKTLNEKVRFKDSSIVSNAYNKKNVYYIQIGGAGLFYLNKNPYNLPIPQFEGEIDIEFRLGPSGSKPKVINGETYRVLAAAYRAQGRLVTKIKSNLSLDNEEQAIEILLQIIKHRQKNKQ